MIVLKAFLKVCFEIILAGGAFYCIRIFLHDASAQFFECLLVGFLYSVFSTFYFSTTNNDKHSIRESIN